MLTVSVIDDADAAGRSTIESKIAELLEYTPRFATITKDANAVVTGVDDAVTVLLGSEAQELIGRRSIELMHPDDHPAAGDDWLQMLQRARPRAARTAAPPARGRALDLVRRSSTTTGGGSRARRRGGRDRRRRRRDRALEELHKRERLLDQIADAIPVGLFQFDSDLNVVYANDRLYEILAPLARRRHRHRDAQRLAGRGCTAARRDRRRAHQRQPRQLRGRVDMPNGE